MCLASVVTARPVGPADLSGRHRGADAGILAHLRFHEIGVGAIPGHQVGVRANLGDASGVENHDAVGVADGREPMRDDQDGATCRRRHQRIPDGRLVSGIKVRGRLVEDQDRCLTQEGARQGQALTLPARE